MKSEPPKIDARKFSDLLKMLKGMVPHYTPEWAASDENDSGVALLNIFCHITENVVNRFNQVPQKNFVAFLDMLGIKLLPAQPARVPLTFKLAEGTDKEIWVPERTQAATDKNEEHEELPFETEKNLLAIPSLLKKVISVDPKEDAIYLPPPGFLNGEPQSKNQVTYKIVSSPSADARNFQLDHVTDLKKDDFLKIVNGDNTEYVVISSISGTIVNIKDSLLQDSPLHAHPANTPVEKVTEFTLFEGKNMQEHILYIGHKDLFNVKSTAQFSLDVTHLAGTEAGVTPLKLSWEYWGEIEGKEGEKWRKFNTIDGTQGFSKDGQIELVKMTKGEIKEKKINGVESRWIRCIIKEPLPADVPRKLPKLDNIVFKVKSSGENLLPDQAFNNEIPLDITQPFSPFGKEPRMFDNFSIGGKEIFSKKGAKVEIDVKVKPRGILAAPTAIEYGQKIKVFARGTYGRLMEVEIDPAGGMEPVWTDHGFPLETKIAPESTPSAVTYYITTHGIITYNIIHYSSDYISVFARAENGHLVERFYNGTQWQWLDHGTPLKEGVNFDPSSIYGNDTVGYKEICVFVTGSDGNLYEFYRRPDKTVGKWEDLKKADNTRFTSSPYVVKVRQGSTDGVILKIFVKGENGHLYELDYEARSHKAAAKWKDDELPEKDGVKVASRPFPFAWFSSDGSHVRVWVYVKGSDNNLWEFDNITGWSNKNSPPKDVSVDSDPYGYISDPHGYSREPREIQPGEIHIFVRGTDGNLWEWDNDKYLFSWDDVPGNDSGGLLRFLMGDLDIGWAENTEINKSDDGKTISIVKDKNSAEIIVDEKEEKATLKISDGRTYDLKVKKENGGLIYKAEEWIKHQEPANSKLTFSPFLLPMKDPLFHIFSASSQNSVLEWEKNKNIWNEYKDPNETSLNPTLSWGYWNNKGWVVIKGLKDGTANLLKDGQIMFELPEDIEETEIAGQKNYWIRARIVGGDYGKESFSLASDMSKERAAGTTEQQLISNKNTIRPPIVTNFTICYSVERKPQQCMTYNNLEYLDQTEACKEEDKHFSPFVQLEDKDRTLYLGFEHSFKDGPVKIFFAAKELPFTEAKKPKLEWSYRAKNDWGELSYLDATEGLIKADILELQGPSDFSGHSRFGNYLYWIKGSLAKGEYEESPLLDGIHPNTTWAFQAETIKDEILGSSDGEHDQTFSFLKFPVLKGEEIRVREILSDEEKQKIVESFGEDAIHEEKDETGKVTETWVLWKEVPDFFDSKPTDRHYTLDRATGELQFGDLINGMIPAVGDDNIMACSYQAGGGAPGNVKAGEIKTLKSAVAGVDKVSNPVAADGGADTATVDQMLEIGPAKISHRNRAVTAEDFEWLAKEASRKVVKVRCLPNTNNKKHTEVGWVTLIIVPDSLEDQPKPSLELKRKVRKYLEACCANTLTSVEHIYVDGPSYVEIGVSVDVFVTSIDVVSEVEREARTKLKAFFHPLTGGAEGKGWDFGRDVAASDIYVLLEEIKEVDHVENLKFTYETCKPPRKSQSVEPPEIVNTGEDLVKVKRDCLVATGTHSIGIQPIKGGLT